MPALLFDVVANSKWHDLWQPGFIAVFAISGLVSTAFALFVSLSRQGHLADAAIEGLNAGYPNVGFMGFPIALYALGKDALIPTTIAAIITMCVIFAVTIIIVEIGLQTERHPRHLIIKVGKSLIKNPLLVAPALGALFPLTGVAVPATVETYLKLMGGAASPCALVVLGLFLTGREKAPAPTRGATAFLVSCKLLLQPLLAFLLATFVFQLSPLFTNAAVLLAALPTGTGSYMLAEYHHRDVSTTSRTIIVSTLLSIITISVYVGTVH